MFIYIIYSSDIKCIFTSVINISVLLFRYALSLRNHSKVIQNTTTRKLLHLVLSLRFTEFKGIYHFVLRNMESQSDEQYLMSISRVDCILIFLKEVIS